MWAKGIEAKHKRSTTRTKHLDKNLFGLGIGGSIIMVYFLYLYLYHRALSGVWKQSHEPGVVSSNIMSLISCLALSHFERVVVPMLVFSFDGDVQVPMLYTQELPLN